MEDNYLCIIMEFAEGGDLHVLLKKYRTLKKYIPEKEILQYSWELLQAIHYLHSHNIIHRDLKCLNVFLSKDNHVKLGDLGVSKIV